MSNPKKLLEITNPATESSSCVGWAPSKNRRCRNPIAQHNRQAAQSLLNNLSQAYDDDNLLRAQLKHLATLTLCVRYHRYQASSVADQWHRIIVHKLEEEAAEAESECDLEEEILQRQREIEELRKLQKERRRHREEEQRRDEHLRLESARVRAENSTFRGEQRRREDARRNEEARQEEGRREEARQQDKPCREQVHRGQEETRRPREEHSQQQQASQSADADARTQRQRQHQHQGRERIGREWTESWARYERDWTLMRQIDTSTLDEDVRDSVPWPVKSGRWQDVNETNVRAFLRDPPDAAAEDPRRWRSVLRRQAMRWHEDRLRLFFPKVADDEECLRLANLVMQVVNRLLGSLARL